MVLIEKWLKGSRNYIVGSILYKRLGTDPKLKDLFGGPCTPRLQKLLEEELLALEQKPKVLLQSTSEDTEIIPESTEPVLAALRNEWLPIYQRMNYLRHELDRYPGNEEQDIAARSPLAFEILDLEQKCMLIWNRRDHYVINGALPDSKEKEEPLPDDPIKLVQALESAKRNVRRNKQLAEKHPDNATYPEKVAQYEARLLRIQSKINDHGRPGTEGKG